MNGLRILADAVMSGINSNFIDTPAIPDGLSILTQLFSNSFSFISSILIIIGTWKILEKAGEQGWKAIIPFYNKYTLFKTFWHKKWFWFYFGASILAYLSVIIGVILFIFLIFSGPSNIDIQTALQSASQSSSLGSLQSFLTTLGGADIVFISLIFILLACSITTLILKILLRVKISKSFGKSSLFAVGLIFLPYVFLMILGFSKDKYRKITG